MSETSEEGGSLAPGASGPRFLALRQDETLALLESLLSQWWKLSKLSIFKNLVGRQTRNPHFIHWITLLFRFQREFDTNKTYLMLTSHP
jgi:hypothetical protein